jgi:hypothetical protein
VIANLIEAARVRLAIATPDHWAIGASKLAQHAAPPRYVWVPTRDRFGPAERAGGRQRALFTRIAGVDLHLWASDVADAEARMHAVINALYQEGATSVMPEGTEWVPEAVTERGTLVVLSLAIKVPVCEPAAAVAQATQALPDNTTTVAGDGKLDWGETT